MSKQQSNGQPEEQAAQLLSLVRAGQTAAFDALLTQYIPLIEHQLHGVCAKNPLITAEDREDLRQEAHLSFYRAVMNYDTEQHEVSFGLYAKICVENGLISALRKMRPGSLPLDMEALAAQPTQSGEDDPTRRLREQEDYEALCRVIARTLSPYENNIWQRYISGATAMEIATALGRDVRSVHNAIYRIRHKLRAAEGIDRTRRS